MLPASTLRLVSSNILAMTALTYVPMVASSQNLFDFEMCSSPTACASVNERFVGFLYTNIGELVEINVAIETILFGDQYWLCESYENYFGDEQFVSFSIPTKPAVSEIDCEFVDWVRIPREDLITIQSGNGWTEELAIGTFVISRRRLGAHSIFDLIPLE